jgi:uncharacterized protein (DUF2249 family)
MTALYETIPVEFDCARCASGDKGAELLRRFDALWPLQTFVLVTREEPTSLLQRLQEERGGLFQWASIEPGPPVWRVEIARRAARAGEPVKITEAVEWDHDRLDRLERTAFDAWGAGDSASAEAAFALFAEGLRRHIGLEGALLFPEFERRDRSDANSAPIATLRAEHRQILALVAAIELTIRTDAVRCICCAATCGTYSATTIAKRRRLSTRSPTASSREASATTSCAAFSCFTRGVR